MPFIPYIYLPCTFVLLTFRHPAVFQYVGKGFRVSWQASFRRLQELIESTLRVDFKSLCLCVCWERERESAGRAVFVFLAEQVFWNRSFGYGERRWRRWRQNSCKSAVESFGILFSGFVVVSIWAEENRNIYKCLVVDRTIEMMNWCEFPLNFFWKLASASYVWAWISSSE